MDCVIHLFKQPNGVYIPGDTIKGIVYYDINKEIIFKKIVISLKGWGNLKITKGSGKDKEEYRECENYVDINNVVFDNTKKIPTTIGKYEIPFSFTLPEDIPPSFKYDDFSVNCDISYHIHIKFERPELFKIDKRYKTNINVGPVITPTLPITPLTVHYAKVPSKPFWQKKDSNDIKINTTLDTSVTTPNERLKISYNVINNTNLDIKGVKILLVEEKIFTTRGTSSEKINKTLKEVTAPEVKAGDTQSGELIMDIPQDVATFRNSKIVSRNYFINTVAELSFPHYDAIHKMPIEIVTNNVDEMIDYDAPPPYSQIMENVIKMK